MNPKKVLIAESEPDVLAEMVRSLPASRFDVTAVRGARVARERLAKEEFDVLVLNAEMPGAGGIQLMKTARQGGQHPVTIALAGEAEAESVAKALEGSPVDLLVKPISPARLRAAVEEGLQREAPAARPEPRGTRERERQLKRQAFEQSVLFDLTAELNRSSSVRSAIVTAMDQLHRLVPYDICCILLLEQPKARLIVRPARPTEPGPLRAVVHQAIEDGVAAAGAAIETESVVVKMEEPQVRGEADKLVGGELQSSFGVAMTCGNRAIGFFYLAGFRPDTLSDEDLDLVRAMSDVTAETVARIHRAQGAARRRIRSLLNSSPDGIILIDERGSVELVNSPGRMLLGLEEEEKITLRQLRERYDNTTLGDVFNAASKRTNEKRISRDVSVQQPRPMVLHCELAPLSGGRKRRGGVLILLRDITRQKETERMKSEFVSTVSHELRTPLATAKEFLSIIQDGIAGEVSPQQGEYLGTVEKNIDRLSRIIGNLLDISRIEAGRIELKRKELDAAATARELVSAMSPHAEAKGLSLVADAVGEIPPIYADHDRLIQVLTNLVGNAAKFTESGGRIVVRARWRERSSSGEPEAVEFSVIDNGIGIPAEEKDRVFEKFHQVGRTHGPGAKGTGLGLAITKQLVELHGGRLWLESEPGKGTTFFFTLPVFDCDVYVRDELGKRVSWAREQRVPLAFTALSVGPWEELQREWGPEHVAATLDLFVQVGQEAVRSEMDMVTLYDGGRTVAVVAETTETGAQALLRRLREGFGKSPVFQQMVELGGDTVHGTVTYPHQASSPEELMSKALKRLALARRASQLSQEPAAENSPAQGDR